jgi:hypothetical protein
MAFLLLAAACNGGNDEESGPPIATCEPGLMSLRGELGGQNVDASTTFSTWSFQQASLPHSLDLPLDGSVLHLEWTDLLQIGSTGAASGRVVMPADAPRAGETICGAGTLRDEALPNNRSSYAFLLKDLSLGPTCPGTALTGFLNGCAATGP